MEDVIGADYTHSKRFCQDTIILADVSKNFQNMSVEIYECNPFHFLSAELAWQAALKKAKKNKFINWHWYVTNGTKRY